MAKRRIYLDWNATAPLAQAAQTAMTEAIAVLGNPSSVHSEGRAARRLVEEARARVAAFVGAEPDQVIFTSGGTEANALALADREWLAGASEHASVLDHAGGPRLAVDGDGRVSPDAIPPAAAVALMAANNETGTVHPLEDIARRVRAFGGLWHCDAVQAAGRLDLAAIEADSLALSAHKLGGPMGVGALVLRNERALGGPIRGAQERRRRGGTENVVGIAGFGAVASWLIAGAVQAMGGIAMPPPPGMSQGFQAYFSLTGDVLRNAFAVTVAATLVSAVYPAYAASRIRIVEALQQ